MIIIIVFIILSSNIITTAEGDNTNEKLKEKRLTGLASVILISIDDSSNATLPILPLQELREINLNLRYTYSASGFFSKFLLLLLKNKRVNINLNIISKPDWCQATFSANTIPISFTGKEQNITAKLQITLDETAPAFERGIIEINVSTPDIKGRFGIITLIKGFEQTFSIIVKPSYRALIDINPKLGINYKLTPYNTTIIPIDITNSGNGRTKVFVEIENVSDKWTVNITDSIILDPNNSNTIYLSVKTDNNYNKAIIKLKFTPTWAENTEIKEKSEYLSFNIENDGSYTVKNTENLIYYIIVPLIIFLIIIFIFITIRRKRNKIK